MIRTSDSNKISSPGRATILLACLRPHLLVPAYLSAATGLVYRMGSDVQPGGSSGNISGFNTGINLGIEAAAVVLGWSLVLASVHLVNLLADRDTDRLNAKNVFWMDHLSGGSLGLAAVLLSVLGLAAVSWGGPRFLLPVGATLLLGMAYSLRPLQLSRRWGWDALANVLGYGVLAPWIGGLVWQMTSGGHGGVFAGLMSGAILHLAPIVFAGFLLTTILDHEGDFQTGKDSWAVRFSPRTTNVLACVILAAAGLAVWWGYPSRLEIFGERTGGPAGWFLAPGWSHLTMTALAILAGWAPRGRRKFLVAAVFATVLAAGGPALLVLPRLGIPLSCWLAGSYLLLWISGRISGSGRSPA